MVGPALNQAAARDSKVPGSRPPFASLSLEAVAKLAALSGALLYGCGLLTVNGYLSQFGFIDLAAFKARYIETGGLVLASVVVILLATLLAFAIGKVLEAGSNKVRGWGDRVTKHLPVPMRAILVFTLRFVYGLQIVVARVYIFALPWLAIAAFLSIGPRSDNAASDALSLYGACVSVGVGCLGLWYFGFFDSHSAAATQPWKKALHWLSSRLRLLGIVASVGLMLSSFVYLFALYGRTVYPEIPTRFGGGEPRLIQLVFSDVNAKTARALDLPFVSPTGNISQPVCLLFEGDDVYLISLQPGLNVRLDKSIVVGVRATKPCPNISALSS